MWDSHNTSNKLNVLLLLILLPKSHRRPYDYFRKKILSTTQQHFAFINDYNNAILRRYVYDICRIYVLLSLMYVPINLRWVLGKSHSLNTRTNKSK